MNPVASLPVPGYALFATRIGACAMAWSSDAICAVQLPESCWGETRERLLLGLHKRHALQPERGPAAYGLITSMADVPDFALQAMAGVQCLLAGQDANPGQAWLQPNAEQTRAGVLGDMRDGCAPKQRGALPDLRQVALDEFAVPEFHRRVHAFTRSLSPGQTCTYGEVAAALGMPGAARAVGQALGANPFAPIVPCHRVLAAGRAPGGFSGGQGALTKLRMLEIEGGAWGGTQSLFVD